MCCQAPALFLAAEFLDKIILQGMSNAVLKIASLQNERWQEPLQYWFISMKFCLMIGIYFDVFSWIFIVNKM